MHWLIVHNLWPTLTLPCRKSSWKWLNTSVILLGSCSGRPTVLWDSWQASGRSWPQIWWVSFSHLQGSRDSGVEPWTLPFQSNYDLSISLGCCWWPLEDDIQCCCLQGCTGRQQQHGGFEVCSRADYIEKMLCWLLSCAWAWRPVSNSAPVLATIHQVWCRQTIVQ